MGMELLIGSTVMAFLQAFLPCAKRMRFSLIGRKVIESVSVISFFLITAAFFVLMAAFIRSDLSFVNVALNSHQAAKLLYKISGVWGNHEGSLLLWLVLFCTVTLFMVLSKKIASDIRISSLQILGFISFSFHVFILLIANPFVQLETVPNQGVGLNPLLEDPSLAIHPPILYTGLALLAIPFALTCSFLKLSALNALWAKTIRPWALAAWCFITLGITLGSWWAYYELGWGGWWFWDPVENASLLPWLTLTALIHSLITVEKQKSTGFFAGFLALISFLLAMFGFSLVRSGVLQSVHSFAIDSLRGYFFFGFTSVLALYAFRQLVRFRSNHMPYDHILSKPAFLFINSITLLSLMLVVLIGTTYPLILSALGESKVAVGAPYFNLVTSPFVLLLIVGLILTPFLNWQHIHSNDLLSRLGYVFTFGIAAFLIVDFYSKGETFYSFIFAALACILCSSFIDLFEKRKKLMKLGGRFYSMHLAHIGVTVVLMGCILDSQGKEEYTQAMGLLDSVNVAGRTVTLKDVHHIGGPYFQREKALFVVDDGKRQFNLKPEKRYYRIHEVITTETAIHGIGLADFYSVLGSYQGNKTWVTKFYWHPFVRLLWWGAAILVLSGLIAFFTAIKSLRKIKS